MGSLCAPHTQWNTGRRKVAPPISFGTLHRAARNPRRRPAVSPGRSVASRNGSRGTQTGVLERGIDLFMWSAQHGDVAGADTRRHVQRVGEQTRALFMKSKCAHSFGLWTTVSVSAGSVLSRRFIFSR